MTSNPTSNSKQPAAGSSRMACRYPLLPTHAYPSSSQMVIVDNSTTESDSDSGMDTKFLNQPQNQLGLPADELAALAGEVNYPPCLHSADNGSGGVQAVQVNKKEEILAHEKGIQTEPVEGKLVNGEVGMSIIQVLKGAGNLGINIQVGSGQVNNPSFYINVPATSGTKRKLEDSEEDSEEDKVRPEVGKKKVREDDEDEDKADEARARKRAGKRRADV